MYTKVKTPAEIAAMRESGRMLATVLAVLQERIAPGMTTKDLAVIAKEELRTLGGQPAFLGYNGFADVLCVSVNSEVVHGIPGSQIIKNGDIVSMDFGVMYRGMITDAAVSVVVGTGDEVRRKLVSVTKESLLAGIAQVKAGAHVGDISHAVEAVLSGAKYGIVRDLVGHGVGHELHEDPNIPNYGKAGSGPVLEAGMTIAIEPMATLGKDGVYMADDGWTILTKDNSLAAHFEHTVLVTETGYEILTVV